MTTTIRYSTDEEHQAGLDRLHELYGSSRDSEEGQEARAIAKALQDYQDEHWRPRNKPTDPVICFEVDLDNGFETLDRLLPVIGGMDAFCELMTRQRTLDAETIDRLVTELGVDRESISGPHTEPPGWELIEDCTDGEDWRAEMLAHRDAKAAESAEGPNRDAQDMQDDAAAREPELVAT